MARRKQDHDHHKHKPKPKKPPKKPPKPKPPIPMPPVPSTVTEDIKAQSTQSGEDAMSAAPGSYPADPANADAVFTTGPGQAVEYNYVRVNGSGGDNYAPMQSSFTAPIAGHGQILTPAAAGEPPAGSENNPT